MFFFQKKKSFHVNHQLFQIELRKKIQFFFCATIANNILSMSQQQHILIIILTLKKDNSNNNKIEKNSNLYKDFNFHFSLWID